MTLVALVAGKGSPGVTTTALALAAVWPRQCALAECDPAGGDLVFRLRGENGHVLAANRGVLSLATSVRTATSSPSPWSHAQTVAGGLPVLVGVASESQSAGIASSWTAVASAFTSADEGDVLADCGRLTASSPLPVLRSASVVVVVCRATTASVAHTRQAFERLRREIDRPALVLAIGGSSAVTQVRDAMRDFGEVDVLGPIAEDPSGADGLAGQWTRRLDRSALVSSARTAARALDGRLAAGRPAAVANDENLVGTHGVRHA
jgi:MinD-like ATPase involved in chromosome partitioning or flagellar assembly